MVYQEWFCQARTRWSILFHKVAAKVYLSYPGENFDVEINEIEYQKQLQMIMYVLLIL